MSIRQNVQTVPRLVVSGYLRAARLPLAATELIARQRGNQQWAPTLAFEAFEAGVESLAGSLLHDPALADKGRLRKAKISQLRKAAELETLAEQERAQADSRLEAKREQVERERQETERRAQQRQQELDRQAALHERKVEEQAEKKASAARKLKAAQDEAITRRERAAKADSLTAEARALDVTKEALRAEETVEVLDGSIQASKEARSSG